MSTPDDARDPAADREANTAGATPSDSTATSENTAKEAGKKKAKKAKRKGLFARFALFLRQVAAELRKVIWPTRSELVNYTVVVLVFVVIMALILAAYDFVFTKAVFFVFSS